MISYEEAKAVLMQAAKAHRLETEKRATQSCAGRVCTKEISAPIDIQSFDNSAMDGFAVRREGLIDASESKPVILKKSGLIAAGDAVPGRGLEMEQCIEIMTGAPVPPAADAVVPVEHVTAGEEDVLFTEIPERGANIRKAGEDFKKGMSVLKAGQMIGLQHVMPLAALGIDKVDVYKKPRAVFLATGKELVDDLSKGLKPGQIYNSNLPYGRLALEAMGCACEIAPSIPDEPDRFSAMLQNYMKQDVNMIISSGAVSAGKFDFVREGLEKVGAEILFHKVKIKPGKPNLFARLPNGTLYFGLPGNPVATAAGLRFFVQPCLRAMMGMEEERPVQARAATVFSKRAGLQMFLKARAEITNDGLLDVSLLDGQSSFMVRPFLDMNCWAVVPESVDETRTGDMVDLYPLFPHTGLI